MTRSEEMVPASWSQEVSSAGEPQLTCAMAPGANRNFLVAVGVLFCVLGLGGLYWLLTGGGETSLEGYAALLVPAGVVLCGIYCFDAALFARTRYLLGADYFFTHKISLFRTRKSEILRQSLVAIRRKYTPPDSSASSTTPGDWVTVLVYDAADGNGISEWPLDGTHTREEAQWLATVLASWAGVPVERGVGAGSDEADADEVPSLPADGKG